MQAGVPLTSEIPSKGPAVIVIRQGNVEAFGALDRNFDALIIWDRRQGDRRVTRQPTAIEHRTAERRGPPPATWDAHGFLLARPNRDASD